MTKVKRTPKEIFYSNDRAGRDKIGIKTAQKYFREGIPIYSHIRKRRRRK